MPVERYFFREGMKIKELWLFIMQTLRSSEKVFLLPTEFKTSKLTSLMFAFLCWNKTCSSIICCVLKFNLISQTPRTHQNSNPPTNICCTPSFFHCNISNQKTVSSFWSLSHSLATLITLIVIIKSISRRRRNEKSANGKRKSGPLMCGPVQLDGPLPASFSNIDVALIVCRF